MQIDESKVIATIQEIQAGKIDYPSFVRGIMQHGICGYMVFIDGGKVSYFDRKGNVYNEHFNF